MPLTRLHRKPSEAVVLHAWLKAIRETSLNSENPQRSWLLFNHADFRRRFPPMFFPTLPEACPTLPPLPFQGKHADAGPLYARVRAIKEKMLGPYHPSLAKCLNHQAVSLAEQVRAIRYFRTAFRGSSFAVDRFASWGADPSPCPTGRSKG